MQLHARLPLRVHRHDTRRADWSLSIYGFGASHLARRVGDYLTRPRIQAASSKIRQRDFVIDTRDIARTGREPDREFNAGPDPARHASADLRPLQRATRRRMTNWRFLAGLGRHDVNNFGAGSGREVAGPNTNERTSDLRPVPAVERGSQLQYIASDGLRL